MTNKQVESDLELIHEIDDSEVELPYGIGDWIERCLDQLAAGKPLTDRDRRKARLIRSKFLEVDE